MRFLAWFIVCLTRLPAGGVPGYWAWFIGSIGIVIGIFDTEWTKVFAYLSSGELEKAALMSVVPLAAIGFLIFGYVLFNVQGGAQYLGGAPLDTQKTGEPVKPGSRVATGNRLPDLKNLPPEVASQHWDCPKCGKATANTSYRCENCGYSIV
jgi:hypothetical protein